MTVKGFFKSNVFRCLVTLLCVLLVSGVFLTIMNGLLAVSDEERFERAISKIYGKSVATETVAIVDPNPTSTSTINEAYRVKDDGNYLVKSTGKGGYSGGTVTCWVVVEINKSGAVGGIGKVVVDSNTAQTQMAEITDKFLNTFSTGYKDGIIYQTDDGFLVANSTMSSNAVCMAVNGALRFVNGLLGNVSEDPYKDCKYIDNIDTSATSHTENEDGTVTFHVTTIGYGNAMGFEVDVTVNREGVITKYEITKNGSTGGFQNSMKPSVLEGTLFVGKNVTALIENGIDYSSMTGDLKAGATQSSYLCFSAAVFAAANYEQFLPEVTEPEQPDEGEEETEQGGNE